MNFDQYSHAELEGLLDAKVASLVGGHSPVGLAHLWWAHITWLLTKNGLSEESARQQALGQMRNVLAGKDPHGFSHGFRP